jgi:Toprim-like
VARIAPSRKRAFLRDPSALRATTAGCVSSSNAPTPRNWAREPLRKVVVKDLRGTAAVRTIVAVEGDRSGMIRTRRRPPAGLRTHLAKRASPPAVAEVRVSIVLPDMNCRAEVHHRAQHHPGRGAGRHLVGLLRYRAWGANRRAKMLAAAGSQRRPLPDPAAEPSRQVILVEGEPDMLAARSHELPAIAVPGVEAWRAEWAGLFAGRHVVIVMDADHQGRAAARRIADDLAPQAKTTIVDIDAERDDAYDLTNWILDGHADAVGLGLSCLFDARRADGR